MPKEIDVNCDSDSSSNDEGDNNKSFVKKVKNHVTGFLPTKLSNWLGGKNRQRDEEDSYELQPPPKRVKRHNEKFCRTSYACNNSFKSDFREPVPGPSISTRKLVLPGSSFNQNQAVQTNGVDSDSDESTSGYSSMPRIGSKEHVSDLPRHNVQQNSANHSVGNKSIFNTSIPIERTLFGERLAAPRKQNTSLSSRRPSFNSSAFGAPNFLDRTLTTRRIIDSPFYHGRIAYGGASAYNRSLISTSPEPASPRPLVKPIQVNDNQNAALSKTAQRILYTLENYTSPAQDVRRIPKDQRRTKPCNLLGQFQAANPYTMRDSLRQPSNRELQVPSTSDLLRMKLRDKMNDSTMQLREIAKSSNLAANEEYSLGNREVSEPSTKSTNKIKTKVLSVRQKTNLVDDVAPEVNLPDVQLPISTLPTFNFTMPFSKPKENLSEKKDLTSSFKSTEKSDKTKPIASVTSSIASNGVAIPPINFKNPDVNSPAILSPVSKISTPPKLQSALEETKKLVQVTSTEFKFSKPLIITENKFKALKSINDYKFSNPLVKKVLNGLPAISKVTVLSVTTLPKNGFGNAFKTNDDKWECSECMAKNISSATTCICCTTPKGSAEPAVNGSSKTIPVVTAFSSSTTSCWGDKFKAAKGSWTCSECMITNDVSKEMCAACESPKPGGIVAPPPPPAIDAMLNYGKKADEWKCPSCMVNNTNTTEKCVCCETSKPGANPASTLFTTSTFNLNQFSTTKSDTWECSACMIRNKFEKAKCEACENPRPAGVAPPKEIEGFKKKDNEWECSSCMVRNSSSKEKCVCCEAPKPGSKPVPTAQVKEVPKFSFGIENGLINGQGFMFGIPAEKNVKTDENKVDFAAALVKSKSESPSTQFMFGIKSPNGAKTTLPAVTANVAEVLAVKPSVPATPACGAPTATGIKRSTFNSETDAAKTSKKDTTLPVNPVNGSLYKVEVPKFAFGVMNNVPPSASNTTHTMFGVSTLPKPATLGVAATSAPIFGSNTTTSTPSFSFSATSTTSNAQKNDLGSAPAPEKPAAPVFKFGGGATVPAATPSMFSVGSNATNGPTPTPCFNFSATSAKTANPEASTRIPGFNFGATDSKPTFGSAPTALAPTFGSGSNSTSIFGASTNAFGITNHNTTPGAPAPTFGNSSTMTFGGGNTSAPLTFAAAKVDPPTFGNPSATPVFGGGTTVTPTFGKPTTNGLGFGATNNSTPEVKPAFNFGSSAAQPLTVGTFSFGSSTGSQSANGTFNFGGNNAAPTMNGTSPAFNFTAATPSASSFSVPPTESRPAQNRVIRRAVRRTPR